MTALFVLKDEHLTACAELFVDVFNREPWNDQWTADLAYRRLKEIWESPNPFGLVQLEAGKLNGFLLGNSETWFNGTDFHLKEMCVRTEMQGQGIGTAFIRELEVKLIHLGIQRINLATFRGGPAEKFYLKHEFGISKKLGLMFRSLS